MEKSMLQYSGYDPNYVLILTAPDEKAGRMLNRVMCLAIPAGPNVI